MVVHMLGSFYRERCRGAHRLHMGHAACSMHWRSFVHRVFDGLGKRLIIPIRRVPVPGVEHTWGFCVGAVSTRASLLEEQESTDWTAWMFGHDERILANYVVDS